MLKQILISLVSLAAICANAQTPSPKAVVGGIFYMALGAEPSTLNPLGSTDLYETAVNAYTHDTLMSVNLDTYEFEPGLATSYTVSKDGLEYTFKIRQDAKFSDGKPVTIEDVKFSFDVIFNDGYKAFALRSYLENIEKAEIVDATTIKFKVKTLYYNNFNFLAGLTIVPKHIYQDAKKGVKITKQVFGSGPYKLENWDKGKRIILTRNPDWWGFKDPKYKGTYNFDKIIFRFSNDENIKLEMLKKGDLDYMDLRPEAFAKRTSGPEWGKKVFKEKVENLAPKSYGFIGWNFKKPLFQDKKVRQGLAYLVNRPLMLDKFYYNLSLMASGPWYQQSMYANPSVKPIPYDSKKALALFKEAGWSDSDKDGVLDKVIDGQKQRMSFSIITANPETQKILTVYKEDAKKYGVDITIKLVEWNTLVKLMDDASFDAVSLGWGAGSVDLDPKQIWHSASAVKGGSNFIGYKNPKVDELIDKARVTMDRKSRIPILQEVYKLIADDAPYVFMFNQKYDLYGHTARVKMEKKTYKYGVGSSFWWLQP